MRARKPTASRVYGGVGSSERAAQRQRAFLDAGLQVFGTQGFKAASVRRLCAQARLTDRYFYQSFDSLESLLVAVFRESMEGIRHAVVTALQSVPPDPDARRLIEAGLEAFFRSVEDPRIARVCWVEVAGISSLTDEIYVRSIHDFAELLLQTFRRARPCLHVDEESRILAVALVGAISHAARDWLLTGGHTPRETLVAATARILLGTLTTMPASTDTLA